MVFLIGTVKERGYYLFVSSRGRERRRPESASPQVLGHSLEP